MSPEVLGVEMSGSLRGWDNAQRRVGSLLALGIAGILLLAAVVVYFLMGESGAPVYWTLIVLVVVALLFEVLLLVLRAPRATAQAAAPAWNPEPVYEAPVPVEPAAPWAPPAAHSEPVRTLTLRCGDCGTVFDLSDTGERPLHHTCPGCGAEGMLRAESSGAPQQVAAVEAPAPAPVPAVRRLKLRCGGCKEIFAIEDSGERPLRRPCPYCGRTGEVR